MHVFLWGTVVRSVTVLKFEYNLVKKMTSLDYMHVELDHSVN